MTTRLASGRARLTILLAVGVAQGCGDGAPPLDRTVVVDSAVTLVSAASERLASPYALCIGPDGDIYVADRVASQILVVGPDGSVRRTIGREGSGPGEIRTPAGLVFTGDTLRVLDIGNLRVQLYRATGEDLGTAPMAPRIRGGPRSYRADGWVAVGTRGLDSVLAQVYDAQGVLQQNIGVPVVPPSQFWDFREIKNTVVSGTVPDILRNVARPVFGADGGFWLLFDAAPTIRRYDSLDRITVDVSVDEPETAAILDAFFERNRHDPRPNSFSSLTYFADAVEIDDRLWVLLETPDSLPSVVLIMQPDGTIEHRVTFAAVRGATSFVVDRARAWVYFGISDDASVMGAPVPEGLLGG